VDKQSLQLLLDQGMSIERIAKRFGKDPSTISYWMNKHGLESPYRERHAAKGGIERERLEELVEAGMTTAEIAGEVGLSKGSVRHWLRRFGLKTTRSRGRRSHDVARAGKEAGVLTVTMTCRHHGETEFYLEGRGYYRCKRCRSEAVTRRRRKVKRILVEEAGGRCVVCGYDRCVGALEFHHLDPSQKRLGLSYGGFAHALSTARAEAEKCVLLCSNCHTELENGVINLPARVLSEEALDRKEGL
jgi:transposase-like protein